MKRPPPAGAIVMLLLLGLSALAMAAGPAATAGAEYPPLPDGKPPAPTEPAMKCLSELRALDTRMEQDGHWLGGSGYGYGYPMAGYSYPMDRRPGEPATGHLTARPGYDVRTLVAAANILARHGKEEACIQVLAAIKKIYRTYLADMKNSGVPTADVPAWQNRKVAAAQPVASSNTAFRSDELIGVDVRNPQNEALGSVDDLVMNAKTGRITYLVITQGGIFGTGETYIPVPWSHFKVTPDANLLVLDTTTTVMGAAPQISSDHFSATGRFSQDSRKVDAFWQARLAGDDGVTPKD